MKSATTIRRSKGRSRARRFKDDRLPPGVPNPIDIHVGGRVKLRRTLLGMSQEKLGDAVALTFQQIQKYERGANRIGASRMFELSRILGTTWADRMRASRPDKLVAGDRSIP